MKTLEVIARLLELENKHPGMDVLIDAGGLWHIEDIDVPCDDEGIVIWPLYELKDEGE